MQPFEPLVRIGRTAFPYWLIVVVILSVLAAFQSKRLNNESFLFGAVGQICATCAFAFMALGIYAQLTGNAMSFVELLPSSLLVATVFSAPLLVFAWSKETDAGLGILVVGVVLSCVVFGVFLAFVVSFFPKVIAFQWHVIKRL